MMAAAATALCDCAGMLSHLVTAAPSMAALLTLCCMALAAWSQITQRRPVGQLAILHRWPTAQFQRYHPGHLPILTRAVQPPRTGHHRSHRDPAQHPSIGCGSGLSLAARMHSADRAGRPHDRARPARHHSNPRAHEQADYATRGVCQPSSGAAAKRASCTPPRNAVRERGGVAAGAIPIMYMPIYRPPSRCAGFVRCIVLY